MIIRTPSTALLDRLQNRPDEVVSLDIETTGFALQAGDVLRGFGVGLGLSRQPKPRDVYLPFTHPDSPCLPPEYGRDVLEAIRRHPLIVMTNSPFDRLGIDVTFDVIFEDQQVWDLQTVDHRMHETADHRLKEGMGVRIFGVDAKAEKDELKALFKGQSAGEIFEQLRFSYLHKHGLKKLPAGVSKELHRQARDLSLASKRDWATITAEEGHRYYVKDTRLSLGVFDWQTGWLEEHPEYAEGLPRAWQINGLAYRIRKVGVGVDRERAEALYEEANEAAEILAASFEGINLRSAAQVRRLLYETWQLPVREMTKGGKDQKKNPPLPSTNQKVLKMLTYHPGVADIIDARKLFKAISAFYLPLLDKVGPDGRVHPSWSPFRPESGRWSCAEPNLMQIPRRNKDPEGKAEELMARVSDVFVPRPGYIFVHADLPSAELRIAAILSGEESWLEALRNGDDMHQLMADRANITRHAGKTQNYQNLYGGGGKRLAQTLGYATGKPFPLGRAYDMVRAYWAAIPRVRRLFDGLGEAWMRRGRLHIKPWPGVYRHRWNEMMQHPEPDYKALNAVIQATIAQLVNDWLLWVEPRVREINGWIVAQCHDAMTLEVPILHAVYAKELLQTGFDTINVGLYDELPWPLDIEIGVF